MRCAQVAKAAEAVSAVAYYVRRLLGTQCAGDGAVEDMTGTSLEHLANLADRKSVV